MANWQHLHKPSYLQQATRRKYNVNFIGARKEDIEQFWKRAHYRRSDINNTRPTEKLRSVVDISAKEHVNYAWDKPDMVEIKGSKGKEEKKSESFQLTFGESWKYTFGGGVNVGATFFNPTFAAPSIGVGLKGQVNRSKSKSTTHGTSTTESLLHTYRQESKVRVSPRSKMTARITTYAVTWELPIKTEISIPASASILVYVRIPGCCCCCGGTKTRTLTAQDLFREEPDYRMEDDWVYFTRDSALSYVGETIEVTKTEKRLLNA